jgi:NAD(P)H-hydrate epimerase
MRMPLRLRPLSRQEVRRLDARAADELAIPSLLLMENAGRGAAGWLAELTGATPAEWWGRSHGDSPLRDEPEVSPPAGYARVLVLCGAGNNGGDGGVVARHLDAWGFPVHVVWFARRDQLRGDAAIQWTILERSGLRQSAWFDAQTAHAPIHPALFDELLAEADWLVDGLLGTGLSRPVEDPLRTLIEAINHSGKPVFALDVPSGLDADTGCSLGVAIRATATATFVAAKLGFSAPGAAHYTGKVTVIDIGLPRVLLEPYFQKDSERPERG